MVQVYQSRAFYLSPVDKSCQCRNLSLQCFVNQLQTRFVRCPLVGKASSTRQRLYLGMARFCRQRRSRSSCKRSWKWPEVSCPYLSLQIIAYKYTFLHELACNNCDMHTNEYNKMFIIHYHNSVVSLLTQNTE